MALSSRYAFAIVTAPTPESSRFFRQRRMCGAGCRHCEGAEGRAPGAAVTSPSIELESSWGAGSAVQQPRLGHSPRTGRGPASGLSQSPLMISASVRASHRPASALVAKVWGAGRSIPSGPLYRACQRPEGRRRMRPKRRFAAIRQPALRSSRADRLDHSGLDELLDRGLGDADMPADVSEPDAPFSNEPPHEPRLGSEHVGGLLHGEQPVDSGLMCVIAPPSVGWFAVKDG